MTTSARPLPEGTVTVLFTDVEGSTALTSRLGDEAARSLLRSIENVIREQIEAHHGVNVKGLGDGIMGAFQSARRAIDCSIGIQRELDRRPVRRDTPLRVRIGLNTGEVIHEREGLFGNAVNAAQRIESAAEPGTILISSMTRGASSARIVGNELDGGYFSICRYRGTLEAFEPITNVDLFVNAVTASVVD